ncbi:oligosaccharide repeat unit polymerase [Lysinibacillus telephonicus]|uniref:oligosaccharide repeat unit polymerase n=1 Tax=Lysinibacillus telephonicus TaxID=1714840 RepID=UPI003B9FFC80
MNSLKKNTILHLIIYTVLFKFLLEISYFIFSHPLYEYYGFTLDINYYKFVESWLIVLLTTIFVPFRQEKPSNLILLVLFFITIIPIASIYWLKNEERIYYYSVLLSFILIIILIKILPIVNISLKGFKPKTIKNLLVIIAIGIMGIIFIYNGFPSIAALNFNNVYNVRSNFNYGSTIMQYLVTWLANIFNMLLLLIALINRKKFLFIFSIAIQLLLFLYTGNKSFLFSLIVFPLVFYMVKYRIINKLVLLCLPLSIIAGIISYKLFDFYWIASLSINRIFFLPAQISFQYYEFFSENKLMLLQHSIFEPFSLEEVYPEDPVRMIGIEYYNSNWPNTGYVGDAYMNFGIIGIFIFSILVVIILRILDSISKISGDLYLITMTFSVIFVLNLSSTGLLTSMLTGGIGLILLILLFYKQSKNESVRS